MLKANKTNSVITPILLVLVAINIGIGLTLVFKGEFFERAEIITFIENSAIILGVLLILSLIVFFWFLPRLKRYLKRVLTARFPSVASEENIDKGISMVSKALTFNTCIAFIAAFGSLFSISIALRQNNLLTKQIERTEWQIISAESQRRADMNNEIFAILKQVEEYAESDKAKWEKDLYCESLGDKEQNSDDACDQGLLVLPNGLKGRIQTIAASANPYYVINPVKVNKESWKFDSDDKPLSPQRGNLLKGLAASKVSFSELNADFSYADLRGADLSNTNLAWVKLKGADLTGAKLIKTHFRFTNLENAVLKNIEFIIVGGMEKFNGQIEKGKLYNFQIISLEHTENLAAAELSEGWRVLGKRYINGFNEWIIETPYGEYSELLKEQRENLFSDLYAKQEALKAKKLQK